MPLPPYYLEVILVGGMACLVTVVMNSRRGLQVLFVSFTKGPGGFPYVLIIINLSSKPLTPAQRSVLAKGPSYAVTPRQPPSLEYITAIEAACTKLSQQDAEELRANINRVLRSSHPPNLI